MNSISFPFLPFLLLILVKSPVVYAYYDDVRKHRESNKDEWFFDCKNSSKCESTEFPLWRDNGTQSCGYQESMKVSCERSKAIIEILGAKYRLLGFDKKDQILIIAKLGIPDVFCSQDHSIPPNSMYVMIPVTNCRDTHLEKPICFGTEFSYKALENWNLPPDGHCMSLTFLSVVVPISPLLLKKLDDDLGKVAQNIKQEFISGRKVDAQPQSCGSCSVLGGVCGYDLDFNQTRYYCLSSSNGFEVCLSPPRPEPPQRAGGVPQPVPALDEPKKPKKTTLPLIIVLGVSIGGGCLVATILVCCINFYCLKRKKKHPLIISREGPAPTLLLNSSFHTQSIPSYPSSKSDHLIEKPGANHAIQVFNYTDLQKATGHFNPSRVLGDGGCGTVYYGMLQDGREVAVKRLYEHNCKRVEQFMNEVDILANLQHKNLVKLYGCTSRYSRGLLLVYEYIPNGTVADHLHGSRAKFGLLSWPIRLRIAIETANALVYLHRSEIVHRDVKTNNILLDNNFTVKVADFGLSRLFPTNVTHVSTTPQGTPGYVDPEYYQCYQLTTKSDVYSFGVVLIELISSLRAVDTDRKRQDINLSNMALSKIQSQALNELIDPKLDFDKNHVVMRAITSVAELAFRCLQQEKDMRPSMEEVVEELREIENDKFSFELAKVVDIGVVGDEIELTKKRMLPSFSPNYVIANN